MHRTREVFNWESNDQKCGFEGCVEFWHVGVTKRMWAVRYLSTCPITDHVLIMFGHALYISPTLLRGPNLILTHHMVTLGNFITPQWTDSEWWVGRRKLKEPLATLNGLPAANTAG